MSSKAEACVNTYSLVTAISSRVATFSLSPWRLQENKTSKNEHIRVDTRRHTDDELSESFSDASTVAQSGASTPQLQAANLKGGLLDMTGQMERQTIPPSQIDWELAEMGYRLGQAARVQTYQDPSGQRSRAIHVDATRYMLMALPADLDAKEYQSLQRAMPVQVSTESRWQTHELSSPQGSLIRQSIAEVVYWMIIALTFALPLLLAALNSMIRFERRHRISERFLNSVASTASELAVRFVVFYNAFLKFKEGRAGLFCCVMISGVVDAMVSGCNDGLSRVLSERTGQESIS